MLQTDIDLFVQQYGRKKGRDIDPNDRSYDRDLEEAIKRMDPLELDRLLRGEEEPKGAEDVDEQR